MQYIYDFNLEEIVNIDNYFDFLEIYLKENQILKKDFFSRTSICANSYRFFLRNKEKNKIFYYNIIANEFNLFLPTEQELKELSKYYSKIVEDILYKRLENLEEDRKIIEEVRKRNNPNANPKIQSMEAILFEILSVMLELSFGKNVIENYEATKEIILKIIPYDFVVLNEYRALYMIIKMVLSAWDKKNFDKEITSLISYARQYHFLQPLFYKSISDSYYLMNDYANSIIFGIKAYDNFIATFNFQRAISTKINLSYSYMLMGSYIIAYQSLSELYLSINSYNRKQKNSIFKGMVESLMFLQQYLDVYEFVNRHHKEITGNEIFIEYLFVLYYLHKNEEFDILYKEFIVKWKNHELNELYYDIVRYIYLLNYNARELEKKREKIKKVILKLNNKTFVEVCMKTFNLDSISA